jgi:hypothetical protein
VGGSVTPSHAPALTRVTLRCTAPGGTPARAPAIFPPWPTAGGPNLSYRPSGAFAAGIAFEHEFERLVVPAADDASMTSPEALDRYRCQDRSGPGGQRCQLLIQHDIPVHIASIDGTFRAWVDDAEATLPHSPYPWFVSFPRDES